MAKKEFLVDVTVDGKIGVGTDDPKTKLHVANGTLRSWTPTSGTSAIFESTASNRNFVTLTAANQAELWFGNASAQTLGRIRYEMANNNMGFWTNASPRMVIDGTGNVGIGDDTPSYKLDVNGAIRATGSITENSDESLKENIQTIDNACEKVSKLRGVSYNKIGEEDKKIGVIAQEIEAVVPEVVTEDVDGIKSVSYTNLVGLLIQSNKELIERVSELENIINNKD